MKISLRLKKLVAPVLVLATAMFGLTVAVAAPASAGADRQVTIHYNRPDGNYADWNIWSWVATGADGAETGLTNPTEFNGEDAYGKKLTFTITNDTITKIGFIVRTNSWAKDPDGDRFINLASEGTTDVWLRSGDSTVYTSNPFHTVTIHYNRPDGEYGDWNVWSWVATGADGASSGLSNPTEFNGEDSYGVKLTFTLTDASITKLGFIIRTNAWAKDPDGDRFINVNATGNTEVWLRSGDSTVYTYNPHRTVTIHYNRPDAQYDDWNMWTWGVGGDQGLSNPTEFNGTDDYGVKLTWTITDIAVTRVGFIVRTNSWAKDPDGDRFIDLPAKGNVEVWLKSGDSNVYTSDPRGRTLVIHYWRPGADYEIWNLWSWSATDGATHDWINPSEFNGTDDQGVTFTGLITDPNLTRIGLIVRTNSWSKDTPNDRFVNLTDAPKQEIWLKQGIAQIFYSNPWGDDPTVQRATIRLSGLTASAVASLPAKTNRGSQIHWVSYTPATCAISGGHNLRTFRPGACRIVGNADATEVARAVTFKRTVTVK
jgi:hypothetical protein